jgi:hypothetical protein
LTAPGRCEDQSGYQGKGLTGPGSMRPWPCLRTFGGEGGPSGLHAGAASGGGESGGAAERLVDAEAGGDAATSRHPEEGRCL